MVVLCWSYVQIVVLVLSLCYVGYLLLCCSGCVLEVEMED